MKQTRKQIGQLGIALILIGLAVAISAAVLSRSQSGIALLMVFGGSLLYIPGGMLAVSHFGYSRGSKLYVFVTLTRMIYALAAVITFAEALGRPA